MASVTVVRADCEAEGRGRGDAAKYICKSAPVCTQPVGHRIQIVPNKSERPLLSEPEGLS